MFLLAYSMTNHRQVRYRSEILSLSLLLYLCACRVDRNLITRRSRSRPRRVDHRHRHHQLLLKIVPGLQVRRLPLSRREPFLQRTDGGVQLVGRKGRGTNDDNVNDMAGGGKKEKEEEKKKNPCA